MSDDAGVEERDEPCADGEAKECGSDVGACRKGTQVCEGEVFGPCEGGIQPGPEACNGIDDDCDGTTDEDFHVGEACDGPDTDLCADDHVTCDGCTRGDDARETCNGIDDDCDGVIDSDCELGDCQPKLYVTGSVPSSSTCTDFPVEGGSSGVIEYPCGGGQVTATLGSIQFSGTVQNGYVSLYGEQILGPAQTPDGCTWRMTHAVFGTLSSGSLAYAYNEIFVEGTSCWSPCTESGTIQIEW